MANSTPTAEQLALVNEMIENSERIVNDIKNHIPGNLYVCAMPDYFLSVGTHDGKYFITYATAPREYGKIEAEFICSRVKNGHGKTPVIVPAKKFHADLLADAVRALDEMKTNFAKFQ